MDKYDLSNSSIDKLSEYFSSALRSLKVSKQTVLKARLTAEDILLKYQQRLGEDACVSCRIEKRLSYNYFVIGIDGASADPFMNLSEDEQFFNEAMQSMGCVPTWDYKNGKNLISFSFRRRWFMSSWISILIVAILGVILGFAAHLLPDSFRGVLCDSVLSPLSGVITGFLSTLSVLMVFLSIISGICEMGDITTFNRVGKRMLGHFGLGLTVASAILFVFAILAFDVSSGASGSYDFESIWKMILDIIPTNIIAAFYDGNTLQIIFLAVCVGVVALSLSRKVQALQEWTKQLNTLVQALIELIVRLLPLVVFVSIFNLVAVGDFDMLSILYLYPLYFIVVCLIWTVIQLVRTSVSQKVNIFTLMKKVFPSYLIAMSTASSAAAFHTSMDICENELGIDKRIVKVGAPLAQPLFMPAFTIEICVGTLCIARMYGMEINWSMLITLLVMGFILAVATPPVPGASISTFALVFSQFGIPASAIPFVIAVNVITDRVGTPTNVLSQQLELVHVASRLGKIDHDILRRKK